MTLLKNKQPKRKLLLIFFVYFGSFLNGCTCKDPLQTNQTKDKSNSSPGYYEDKGQIAALQTLQSPSFSVSEMTEALAIIEPLKESSIKGTVKFSKVKDGVHIRAVIQGLTPGKHGLYIHEFGECQGKNPDFIGAHYHPFSQDGQQTVEGQHLGDLGYLMANQEGKAFYETVNKMIKLQGKNSILGRSIVINAKEEEETLKAGASKIKVACGVIEPIN